MPNRPPVSRVRACSGQWLLLLMQSSYWFPLLLQPWLVLPMSTSHQGESLSSTSNGKSGARVLSPSLSMNQYVCGVLRLLCVGVVAVVVAVVATVVAWEAPPSGGHGGAVRSPVREFPRAAADADADGVMAVQYSQRLCQSSSRCGGGGAAAVSAVSVAAAANNTLAGGTRATPWHRDDS